jgi:hypothetical protein
VNLKWTEGNIWKLAAPLHVSKRYFKYKYVILQQGSIVKWEAGIDRLADLAVLPEVNMDGSPVTQAQGLSPLYKQTMKQSMGLNNQVRIVAIHDNWE